MPAVYESSQFDVLTGNIPNNWMITQINAECLILGPEAWRKSDFWVECYDYDPAALAIYRREVQKIYEEENDL